MIPYQGWGRQTRSQTQRGCWTASGLSTVTETMARAPAGRRNLGRDRDIIVGEPDSGLRQPPSRPAPGVTQSLSVGLFNLNLN